LKNLTPQILKPLFIALSVLFVYGCITPKDTTVSRKMQNLTARYNYIYNSNVLLTEYNEALLKNYEDNYEQILPVYLDPEPKINLEITLGKSDKLLDEVVRKAQKVINEKGYSNYIDDAYMLLGKASHLKGNYFMASEYFDYAAKTYRNNLKTYVLAMNWKARSQMELNNMHYADKLLDTMLRSADSLKTDLGEPLATTAQMRIYQHRYKEAILLLQAAIRSAPEKQLRIRWQYILAQLQQQEKDFQNAFINFTKVENSNAPFEMYFHANLQRIKLKALISGYKINEDREMLALLKDDKNFDYIDQIYYHVGQLYYTEGEIKKAEDNYLKSVRVNSRNQNQKALSYLKIADLNFNELKNYLRAKIYYDSTVSVLPRNFPDYDLIVKKAANLQYLTDRFSIISREDTLQTFAKLPEGARAARIKALLTPKVDSAALIKRSNNPTQSVTGMTDPALNINNTSAIAGSTFYFSNTTAISNGLSDFKKKWGNRPYEDNWRQSVKSSAQETSQMLSGGKLPNTIDPVNGTDSASLVARAALEKEYLDAVPTTSEMLAVSNLKIMDAYFEIASFYQQELNDKEEATKIYHILLDRFPENNHLVAIYYALYLNYKGVDENKSNEYRQLVITKFPESNFAKSILDPSFSAKQTQAENTINTSYNLVFDNYIRKNYNDVIQKVNESNTNFPNNDLAPQFAYLKAIAIGRNAKVDALLTEFNSITANYPDDKIVTPLVRDHLKYIEANLEEFKQRPVALIDFDSNAPRFVQQAPPAVVQPKPIKKETDSTTIAITATQPVEKPVEKAPENKTAEKPASVFSAKTSEEYYFVIDVADATLTLSSSRFGIGQFNRGNYPDNDLAHKLIELDNDQLIYITSFVDLEDARIYQASILSQLKNIMKVPADKYQYFIISKENFEKLTNKDRIKEYLDFYRNNY